MQQRSYPAYPRSVFTSSSSRVGTKHILQQRSQAGPLVVIDPFFSQHSSTSLVSPSQHPSGRPQGQGSLKPSHPRVGSRDCCPREGTGTCLRAGEQGIQCDISKFAASSCQSELPKHVRAHLVLFLLLREAPPGNCSVREKGLLCVTI